MLYIFKDSDSTTIGTYNLGENSPRDYIGQTINGSVVETVELENPEDALTDRELTIQKDETLRTLIANLTARIEALENR